MKPRIVSLAEYVIEALYIPHGSDETAYTRAEASVYANFISHMVQMKLFLMCKMCKMCKALYPTWFRWNANNIFFGLQ